MAHRLVDRPVQLRADVSDEEYVSDDDEPESNVSEDHNDSTVESDSNSDLEQDRQHDDSEDGSADPDSDLDSDSSGESEEQSSDLRDISFGALAKAQATLGPPSRSKKLKQVQPTTESHHDDQTLATSQHSKSQKQDSLASRTSKHAPTILSSRHQVSRKRTIFSPPPNQKSRDPRFDPTITSSTLNQSCINAANKAYSFLTDYQATEILALKSEIKKSQINDPQHADELKKKLMSMESQLRNAQTRAKESEILKRHKAAEKEAIKSGKKARPYFLKQSDLRKEVEKERMDEMGKKAKDKLEKRRRMREKRKEARDMPWARRTG